MKGSVTGETVSRYLLLLGVRVDAFRATRLSEAIGQQIAGVGSALAIVAFETEPASYLAIIEEDAPWESG